jgi:hypothetical protein
MHHVPVVLHCRELTAAQLRWPREQIGLDDTPQSCRATAMKLVLVPCLLSTREARRIADVNGKPAIRGLRDPDLPGLNVCARTTRPKSANQNSARLVQDVQGQCTLNGWGCSCQRLQDQRQQLLSLL